jgi:hypothetical protein
MNSLKTVLLLLPVLISGCGLYTPYDPDANYYYLNPNKDLTDIGRTVLVELDNDSAFPEISANVTEALYNALQKKHLFGLTVLQKKDPAWKKLQLDISPAYTLDQLSAIRRTLKCNAVLKGTITGFEPFPHMIIGLRLKLIDLNDGQLLWALEQIWDTTDETTKDRIKSYYNHDLFPGSATLKGKLGTVSSLKFIKFVAFETAQTLNPKR